MAKTPTTPTIPKAPTMTNTVDTHTAQIIERLTNAAHKPIDILGSTHILVPPEYTLADITKAIESHQLSPNRKRGTVHLHSLDSLCAYLNDQVAETTGTTTGSAQAEAYVYADEKNDTITAVLNDQRRELTGWRDHRAVLKLEKTKECAAWLARDKQKMTQDAFAEFIEDNIADLPDGEAMLNMATTIAATSGIQFRSAKRLQDGQTQLTYNEVIDAKAGADGAMTIPKTFKLGLRIFKNDPQGYALEARLKYRLGGGGVNFHYELIRPEAVLADAFSGYVTKLAEKQATSYC